MSVSNITNSKGLIPSALAGGTSGNFVAVLDATAYGDFYDITTKNLTQNLANFETYFTPSASDGNPLNITSVLAPAGIYPGAYELVLALPGTYNFAVSVTGQTNAPTLTSEMILQYYTGTPGGNDQIYDYKQNYSFSINQVLTSYGTNWQITTTLANTRLGFRVAYSNSTVNTGATCVFQVKNESTIPGFPPTFGTATLRAVISKVDVNTAGVTSVAPANNADPGISVANGTSQALIQNTGILGLTTQNGIINVSTNPQRPILALQSGAGGIQNIVQGPGIAVTTQGSAQRTITNTGVTSLTVGYGLSSYQNLTTGNLQVSANTTNASLVKLQNQVYASPGGIADIFYDVIQGGIIGVNTISYGPGVVAFSPIASGNYTLSFSADFITTSATDIAVTFMLVSGLDASNNSVVLPNTGKLVNIKASDGLINFNYSVNIVVTNGMVGLPLYPRLSVAGLGGTDTFTLQYTASSGTGINTIAACPSSSFTIFRL